MVPLVCRRDKATHFSFGRTPLRQACKGVLQKAAAIGGVGPTLFGQANHVDRLPPTTDSYAYEGTRESDRLLRRHGALRQQPPSGRRQTRCAWRTWLLHIARPADFSGCCVVGTRARSRAKSMVVSGVGGGGGGGGSGSRLSVSALPTDKLALDDGQP